MSKFAEHTQARHILGVKILGISRMANQHISYKGVKMLGIQKVFNYGGRQFAVSRLSTEVLIVSDISI